MKRLLLTALALVSLIPVFADTPVFFLTGPRIFTRFHDYDPADPYELDSLPALNPEIWLPDSSEWKKADLGYKAPDWLRNDRRDFRFQNKVIYKLMIANPEYIQHSYWNLPVPPTLPEEDYSYRAFLLKQYIPAPEVPEKVTVNSGVAAVNWLHTFNFLAQLSQAYISGNWYQGGNSHLAFVGSFLWDVELNSVYHPIAMFKSTVSYKLSVNSTPDDQYHRYNVSQDLFQYNLKTGFKAYRHWFYSFTTQFKTQFVNSYPANSQTRSASFLSPAELNLGLGMTYTKENKDKSLKFSATVSPVSYNLKICLDDKVEHSQFNIPPDRRWVNDVGSNAEVTFYAKFWGDMSYSTRLFVFSDYETFQGDWENTLNLQFSTLFSTQIYVHMRYDTATDRALSPKWGKMMMKEILSVGLSYNFSTK